jgi:crossover junction endodeoxyribonuclease RusA
MKCFLDLPFPPSANVYYRRGRFVTYLSEAGRNYKSAVSDYLAENIHPKFGDSKLKISMILRPRDKRKIDIDNRIKAVLDALEDGGLFNDDFQIDHLEIIRGEPIKGGKLICIVEQIADQPTGESNV